VTLGAPYFDALYAASPDPWSFRERWYERRKRDLTTAMLPQPRYGRAFEPGCSIGLLTAELGRRCDDLLAADTSDAALATAREHLAGRDNVRLARLLLPQEWPVDEAPFDLVVLSEIGYYFDGDDLEVLLDRAVGSLAAGGTLVACHWRHTVDDYPLRGDVVHDRLARRAALLRAARHEEADLLLEVFTLGEQPTPAQREGLTG
jgi:predicted TPR repeat methyltransferase